MDSTELIALVTQEIKGLSSYLEAEDYSNAVDDALRDTGWSFPVTTSFKIKWMKERTKRHIFFYLYTESAHKFKYKQINLQQRWEHYKAIIKDMDALFAVAVEEYAYEFAGVDPVHIFGTHVGAGFVSDDIGQDMTYQEEVKVPFSPEKDSV
jgi:hypothetical protein